ncbi:MAG: hypothetical protein WCS92_03630, partial [Candidatus Babeliales bacterium]
MFYDFIFRTCVLVLFCSLNFVQVNAKKNQRIKSVSQIFNGVGQSNSDIFAFAKATMEEDSLYNQDSSYELELKKEAQLFLGLQFTSMDSRSDDENVGRYLNITTDEMLRERIVKDYITEGNELLNDCFNTAAYKSLQKELEKFVYAMTHCSFISSEESKKLGDLKIFYPNDYKNGSYSWNPIFKDNKLFALEGSLHKIIGLKGNKNNPNDSCFVVDIDFIYTCLLGGVEERPINLSLIDSDKNKITECCSKIKIRTEAEHSIDISVTFLRQKNFDDYCGVSFFCAARGEERVSLDESEKKGYCNEEKNCNLGESWLSADDI